MIDIRPNSTANPFRRRRIQMLCALIDRVLARRDECRIIDIGGTINFWSTWKDFIDWRRVHVLCVNYDPDHAAMGERRVEVEEGDARNLSAYADKAFDIAFSNSVIEHVGLWGDMRAMADEVRRVAPSYLVQTPHYWFPIEPHARTPLLHWAPEPLAYRVVMMRKCGFWEKARDVDQAVRIVQSAKLIDRRQMQALFPDADVTTERFLLLPKALIARRQAE